MPFLSPNSSSAVPAGTVVVHQGNDVWLPYNQAVNTGGTIAIALNPALPGAPLNIQDVGDITPNLVSLGSGNAQAVVVSSNRLSRGNVGLTQVGNCDPSGRVTLFPAFLNTATINNSTSSGGIPQFVTALSNFGPSNSRQSVTVDGYSTSGDGGGGTFIWNGASVATADGGTVIAVTGLSTGRWVRVFSGPLDVRWFGADPTGTIDSTTAIQNALNLVGLRTLTAFLIAPAIYIPTGTYKISSKLTVTGPSNGLRGIYIFGDYVGYGAGASVLQWAGAAHGSLFQGAGLQHTTFQDVVFDGNGIAGIAFWLRSDEPNLGAGTSGVLFRRCYFINAAGASSDDGAYSACFRIGAVADGQRQIDTVSFEFCYFHGYTLPNTNYGLLGVEGGNQKNYRFNNCTFISCVEPIKLNISGYNVFDTCTVDNFTSIGYNLFDGAGQCLIVGNSTENNWTNLTGATQAPLLLSVGQFAGVTLRDGYANNQMCDVNGFPSAGNPRSLQVVGQSVIIENFTFDGTLNSAGITGACSGIQTVATIGTGGARGTGLVSINNKFVAGDCSPVTSAGTTPPVITFTGTPLHSQTLSTTPYVELDCTLGGARGTWQFTWKLNGETIQTGVVSAATVALTDGTTAGNSGLTANISTGNATASGVQNTWVANRRPSHIQVFVGANPCLDFASATENAISNNIESRGDGIIGPHDVVVCKTILADAEQNTRQSLGSATQTAGVIVDYRGEGRTCVDVYEVGYDILKYVSQNVCLGTVKIHQSVLRVIGRTEIGMTGGAMSGGTCILGKGSPGDTTYLTSFDSFTSGTVASNFAVPADDATWKVSTPVWAQFGFTGDVRTNLTAGKVKFYVTTEFVGE